MIKRILALLAAYTEDLLSMGAQGHVGYFGLAKEAIWGTAVAATDYAELLSEALATTIDRFETRNIYGGFYEADDYAGMRRSAGGITLAGNPLPLGHLLRGAFNNGSVAVVLSGFLHTTHFTSVKSEFANGVPRQPFTLEVFRDVTSASQYAGALVNRLSLSLAPNQDLRVAVEWLAQSRLMIAKTTPTFPGSPTDPFTFETCSVQMAGAANSRFEALNLSIDNQLEGIPALNNSNVIARIRASNPQMIRISGTLDFIDYAEREDFINQTERAMKFTMTRANSFFLSVDVPRFVYTSFAANASGRGRVTATFEGRARYLASSLTAIGIQLTDTRSNH